MHLITYFVIQGLLILFDNQVTQATKPEKQIALEDNAFFDFIYLLWPVSSNPVQQVGIKYHAQGHLSMYGIDTRLL